MNITITYLLEDKSTATATNGAVKDNTSTVLGIEISENIDEVLFPDVNHFAHPITITKFFTGQAEHRWLVERVLHPDQSSINVFLSKRDGDKDVQFLRKTIANNRAILRNLTIGTFVEVEFGYIPSVKKSSGSERSNKRYPDSIQNGEMHKRRLALIVSVEQNVAQVIPVTSQVKSTADLANFEISQASLSNLVSYNSPVIKSFALAGMIQTVSTRRILPPLSQNKGTRSPYRNARYIHRLTKDDTRLLKTALAHGCSMGDTLKRAEKATQLEAENKQISEQLELAHRQLTQLQEEVKTLRPIAESSSAMRETLAQWKFSLGEHKSIDDARNAVDEEAEDYRNILEMLEN